MDPLFLIRQANIDKNTFHHVDGYYLVCGTRFPTTAQTCFKRTLKGQQDRYYTVGDVIFFLQHIDYSITDYRNAVSSSTIEVSAVSAPDKDDLKNYLNGIVDNCKQIDYAVQASQKQSSSSTGGASGSAGSSSSVGGVDSNLEANLNAEVSEAQLEELRLVAEKYRQVVDKGNPTRDALQQYMFADKAYLKALRQHDIPAFTRITIMERPNSDFSFAIDSFKQVRDKRRGDKDSIDQNSNRRTSLGNTTATSSKRTREDDQSSNNADKKLRSKGPPIIIVPNSMTTTISSFNIKDFLENRQFIPVMDKKKAGGKREAKQTLKMKMSPNSSLQDVVVVDTPASLTSEEWDRVIAIFMTGQDWQFKHLKWPNPADLFKNVLGLHVSFDSTPVAPTVLKWNCKVFKINASRRHLDTNAVNDLLQELCNYLEVNKPWLLVR